MKSNEKNSDIKQSEIGVASVDDRSQLDSVDPFDSKLALLGNTPGLGIEMDPDEADALGAFEETALTLEEAVDASKD